MTYRTPEEAQQKKKGRRPRAVDLNGPQGVTWSANGQDSDEVDSGVLHRRNLREKSEVKKRAMKMIRKTNRLFIKVSYEIKNFHCHRHSANQRMRTVHHRHQRWLEFADARADEMAAAVASPAEPRWLVLQLSREVHKRAAEEQVLLRSVYAAGQRDDYASRCCGGFDVCVLLVVLAVVLLLLAAVGCFCFLVSQAGQALARLLFAFVDFFISRLYFLWIAVR